jgi:hypothetical protein
MTDIVERLRLLAARLSDDGQYVDSDICEFCIEEINFLRGNLKEIRKRAIFGPSLTVSDLLDLTYVIAPSTDPTNPFAPRNIK